MDSIQVALAPGQIQKAKVQVSPSLSPMGLCAVMVRNLLQTLEMRGHIAVGLLSPFRQRASISVGDGVHPEVGEYTARISVWVRWGIWGVCVLALAYRPDFDYSWIIPCSFIMALVAAYNGFTHYRVMANRMLPGGWFAALTVADLVAISAVIVLLGGYGSNSFLIYYPALALLAFTAPSIKFSLICVALVALAYAGISLLVAPGLDFAAKDEKILALRVITMVTVAVGASLGLGLERVKRREAESGQQTLLQERAEVSRALHDGAAQSAYIVGLGLDTAIGLADKNNRDLVEKLQATQEVARSLMWELRQPIDGGPGLERRTLSSALQSHVATFTTITSIPTDFNQEGVEPSLSADTRSSIFVIAHNALTNSFRHSKAARVGVSLRFCSKKVSLSISDDGIGLPGDFEARGHGVGSMREYARQAGGELYLESGCPGAGTVITCVIPCIDD